MICSLPEVLTGFRLNKAVLTTYDLSIRAARALLSNEDIEKYVIVRGNPDSFFDEDIKCEQLENRILDIGISRLSDKYNGADHAKIWIFEYVGSCGQKVYRALLLSENICDYGGRTFEIFGSFTGKRTDEKQRDAMQICSLFRSFINRGSGEKKYLLEELHSLCDDLQFVAFEAEKPFCGGKFRLLTFGYESFWQNVSKNPFYSMCSGYRRLFIMSSFISSDVLKMITADEKGSIILVTTKDTLEKTDSTLLKKMTVYITEDVYPHAKFYISEKEGGIELYFGSANATGGVFGANREAMAYFKNPDGIHSIEDALKIWSKGCLSQMNFTAYTLDSGENNGADIYSSLGFTVLKDES